MASRRALGILALCLSPIAVYVIAYYVDAWRLAREPRLSVWWGDE